MNIQACAQNSLLAQASYGLFDLLTNSDVIRALIAPDNGGFSET